MKPEAFIASLKEEKLPDCPEVLQALWWAARGDWDRAHRLVQPLSTRDAALVHAYLHRVEGDLNNARYWYARANVEACDLPLDEEWRVLVEKLLQS